jgi:hypothetical protein
MIWANWNTSPIKGQKGGAVRFIILAGALILAACTPDATAEPPPERPATPATCTAAGGTWDKGGMMGRFLCFLPEPDAGQSCRKAQDCSGFCMADSGTCSVISPQFGCFEFLDDAGQRIGLCLD